MTRNTKIHLAPRVADRLRDGTLPTRPDARNPGDTSGEAIPVPIPNTEVKLSSAEDTERAAFRENRSSPGFLRFRRHPAGYPARVTIVEEFQAESDESTGRSSRELLSTVHDLCPYLEADGGWRSTSAQRDHRCRAVTPPVRLALDKQRRLCTRTAHLECPTYLAARAARWPGREQDADERALPEIDRPEPALGLWQFTRTAPVAIDDGRIGLPIPIAGRQRTVPQAGLGALMVAVLAILVAVRLAGEGASDPAVTAVSPTPAPTTVVGATPTPTITPPPSATPSPRPSPSPTRPSASPTGEVAGATATAPARTYRVRSGDTLYAIALRFETTVKAIQELNEIEDPGRLRVGQVLRIP
jgi:LysM repeat protein